MMFMFNWTGYVDSRPLVLPDLYRQICVMLMKPTVQFTFCKACLHTHTHTHTHTPHSPQMGAFRPLHPARRPAWLCIVLHSSSKKQLNGLCDSKNGGSDRRAACSRAVLSVSLLTDNKVETCRSVMALSCTPDDICITCFFLRSVLISTRRAWASDTFASVLSLCRRWRKYRWHTNSKTVVDRFRLQQCGSRTKKLERKETAAVPVVDFSS